MKRIAPWALLASLGHSRPRALSEPAPTAGGVQQLNDAFLKALQAGDIDGVMKLYAADAVLFPPGEKVAKGQEEIRFKWNSLIEANKISETVAEGRALRRLVHRLLRLGRRLDEARAQERQEAQDDPGPLLVGRGEAQREVGLRLRRHRRARRDPDAQALLETKSAA